jgi:hypothetical protein
MVMRKLLAGFFALVTAGAIAYATNIPLLTGPQDPSQLNATLNNLILQINSGTAQTQFSDRNILDNGAVEIAQRGTGIVTCAAAAAITSAAYGPDRWGCSANVTSGAGRQQVITATPTPPAGFKNASVLYRTSGILTQPICVWQEVPTIDTIKLQGTTVVFSASLQALAAMLSDNGAIANLVIITGTGTDEGFGTMTASPAITPAWTGIATLVNTATTALSSTAWNRYSTSAVVATTVTELAVGLCFTPTAAAVAGTTDGFAWTGAQLESNQQGVTTPSNFGFKETAFETRQAQRYFYRLSETATTVGRAMCAVSTTSATKCLLNFPTTMFKIPTMTYTAGFASCTTVACTAVSACTSLGTDATSTPASPTGVMMVCGSSAAFAAAGSAGWLSDNSGAGVISASADF